MPRGYPVRVDINHESQERENRMGANMEGGSVSQLLNPNSLVMCISNKDCRSVTER